ncbi:hypothetical protein GGF31_008633, partial [Allomyces arbusculus]
RQTEHVNQLIEDWWHIMLDSKAANWHNALLYTQVAINSLVNASTGIAPFAAVFGYVARFLAEPVVAPQHTNTTKLVVHLAAIHHDLAACIELAKAMCKKYTDQAQLQVPDFKVSDKGNAIEVELPPKLCGHHNVYHIAKLKQWTPVLPSCFPGRVMMPPVPTDSEYGPEYMVCEVLSMHKTNHKNPCYSYHVWFDGYNMSEAEEVQFSGLAEQDDKGEWTFTKALLMFHCTHPAQPHPPPVATVLEWEGGGG